MIYLDSGATSIYKPREVFTAVRRAMTLGNPGRGGHKEALAAARELFNARDRIAAHFGAPSPECVCFFYNATTAANIVIKTLVNPGETVMLSDMEHNALRRPALALMRRAVKVDYFNGHGKKEEIVRSFHEKLKNKPALIAFVHRSNICPQTLPVEELCALAHKEGVLTVVDCAQSGGHLPLSLSKIGADAFILPSHKGLMGIAGAGVLICSEKLKKALEEAPTLLEGGSGIRSFEEGMPSLLPERLEWGTPALPAILSVAAGIEWIEKHTYDAIGEKLQGLFSAAKAGLASIPQVRLHGMDGNPGKEGPLLFTVENSEQSTLAKRLYDEGVCLREGFHCAPLAHESIGTAQTGGLRVSFSVYNKKEDLDRFLMILEKSLRCS